MKIKRVLFLAREFPQLSQTYMQSEIEALAKHYEVMVVARREAETPRVHSPPYRIISNDSELLSVARQFKPDVLHGHWLYMAPRLLHFARKLGVPFTLRAHSFDTLPRNSGRKFQSMYRSFRNSIQERRAGAWIRHFASHPLKFNSDFHVTDFVRASHHDACLGILAMPFSRQHLLPAGTPPEKLVDSPPVIDYGRFHDESPNGPAVIHVGAALAKKGMDDFMRLSRMVPEREFNVYPIGYESQSIRELNDRMGRPVNFMRTVQYEEMPAIFKKHQYIAYTAKSSSVVGWPLSLAEAQAAGVGAVINGIRPDLKDYVGEAGLVYSTLDEAAEFLRKPYSAESRRKGFEWARHSDIEHHVQLLSLIWQGGAKQLSDRKWNSPIPRLGQHA